MVQLIYKVYSKPKFYEFFINFICSNFYSYCCISFIWLKEEVINEYKNFIVSNNSSGPTFFLKKFDSTKTDKDGNFTIFSEADYMKHFEGDNKTNLLKPFYTKYKNKKKHSTVYSDTGEVKDKGEEIILRENAILVRLPTKTKNFKTLYS